MLKGSSVKKHHDQRCHIKTIHEGIRYQCDFCERSFTQLPNLKKHVNGNHGPKPEILLPKYV